MERGFSLPSALDSCLRCDLAGCTSFRELRPIGAIGRLRSVGLLAGTILICILTPMRRTALGLTDVLQELRSRIVLSKTK
jgi:hypothetical protein